MRIDCSKAEEGLKTTPCSECALNALAIDEPLEFKNVHFSYENREILHGIDVTLPDRTTTAVIGPDGIPGNGGGKNRRLPVLEPGASVPSDGRTPKACKKGLCHQRAETDCGRGGKMHLQESSDGLYCGTACFAGGSKPFFPEKIFRHGLWLPHIGIYQEKADGIRLCPAEGHGPEHCGY